MPPRVRDRKRLVVRSWENEHGLHLADVGAGKLSAGLHFRQTLVGLFESCASVDGQKTELGIHVGVTNGLLDVVVTLEAFGEDLAEGKQCLNLDALFLRNTAALRGLEDDRVEGDGKIFRSRHAVGRHVETKMMGLE